MRSRARSRPRSSRDADSGPLSSGRYRAVPLARFRREVVALLMAARAGGKRIDSTTALRLVIRWDRMVRLRHGQGTPPCKVADHILKYERDGALCPCGNALESPLQGGRDMERSRCRSCSRKGRSARRDGEKPSRYQRVKAWRDRKMVEKREDFAGVTRNVGAVGRATAQGRVPRLDELESVRTPIGGFKLGRDPGKHKASYRHSFHKTIYRKCKCGETAHSYQGKDDKGALVYACRNCRHFVLHKPAWSRGESSRG